MEVGKKLRLLREKNNMTMYRLTQITGVSGHHIKGIEEGTRQPTIDTLRRLTEALGASMAEFFSDSNDCSYLSVREKHLIDNFRLMDNEKAEIFLALSDVLNR